jgi:lysine-N-methylase
MLLRVPDFYDSFHCIADKCTDTCCVGWEIDIDETSAKRYKTVQGEFGEKLRQNIEDDHFKLLPGDRCPFLRQDGLCNMICNLGEESLCDICREHPRFVEVYGDIMEKGIGLCCEEGVRLLLESKGTATSPIAFIEREIDDAPDEIPDDALEARDVIFEERNHLFKILADHSKPLNVRLIELLDYAIETSGLELSEPSDSEVRTNYKISNNIHHQWFEILGKGDSYGPAWDTAYKELKEHGWQTDTIFSDNDGEKIIAYLLFRYYEKSLFDGNSLTKVEFAIYFWIMLQKLGQVFASEANPQAKIDAIKLLSKQTEYSEEIMEIFEQEFMENPAFSPAIFKRILAE